MCFRNSWSLKKAAKGIATPLGLRKGLQLIRQDEVPDIKQLNHLEKQANMPNMVFHFMQVNNNTYWKIYQFYICYICFKKNPTSSDFFDSDSDNCPHMVPLLFLVYFLYAIFCQN